MTNSADETQTHLKSFEAYNGSIELRCNETSIVFKIEYLIQSNCLETNIP
jgi:hypothetical protein